VHPDGGRDDHDQAEPETGLPGPASWSPPPWRIACYALVGASLIGVALWDRTTTALSLDPPGSALVTVVAIGVLTLAGRDIVARPTLRVDSGGLTVTDGLRPRYLPWAAVTGVRAGAVTHGRRLVHVRVLTIDTIDTPVLLSRRQLAADPELVAEIVERHRLDHR
jgi:hypothetical protein